MKPEVFLGLRLPTPAEVARDCRPITAPECHYIPVRIENGPHRGLAIDNGWFIYTRFMFDPGFSVHSLFSLT